MMRVQHRVTRRFDAAVSGGEWYGALRVVAGIRALRDAARRFQRAVATDNL
jgi:hypothetical protein